MKSLLPFIKKIFSNKAALLFIVGHLVLVILALIDTYIKYGTLSEITGHTDRQTYFITFLMIVNLPVLLVSTLIGFFFGWIFTSIGMDFIGILLFFVIFIFFINFQWALIGYGIDKLFQRKVK